MNEEAGSVAGRDRAIRLAFAALSPFVLAFLLSNVYRTTPALIGRYWAADIGLGTDALGTAAACFNIAFALMQLPLGILLDRFAIGIVQTVLLSIAVLGAVLSGVAETFWTVAAGQLLLGLGMSGSLMGGLVYAARTLPAPWFPAISAIAIAIGSAGMLISASPLAALIEAIGWRGAYFAMAATGAALAVITPILVRTPVSDSARAPESVGELLRGVVIVLGRRQVLAVSLLALASYPAAMVIRGLWIGPYLQSGYDLSTVMVGHAATAVSVAMVIGAPLAGWLGSGRTGVKGAARGPLISPRLLLIVGTALAAVCLGIPALAGGHSLIADVAAMAGFGFFGAVYALQYTVAKDGFAAHLTGRVLTAVNMAFFGGAALIQIWTGVLARWLPEAGLTDPFGAYRSVFGATGVFLFLAVGAFAVLYIAPAEARPRPLDDEAGKDRALTHRAD